MNGELGKMLSTGNAYDVVYSAPAAGVQFSTIGISILNDTNNSATIRIAISTSVGVPSKSEIIQNNLILPANGGAFDLPSIIVNPGEKVEIFSTQPGLNLTVLGIEQT